MDETRLATQEEIDEYFVEPVDTHEKEYGDYLTPGDIARHFDVNTGTVYVWIARGWLTAHPRQKHERYHITIESFNAINEQESKLAVKLRRFLPRVLYGRGW